MFTILAIVRVLYLFRKPEKEIASFENVLELPKKFPALPSDNIVS